MRKLEKIKRTLNKGKDFWVYIENFNNKELFKLPIQQAKILVFKK